MSKTTVVKPNFDQQNDQVSDRTGNSEIQIKKVLWRKPSGKPILKFKTKVKTKLRSKLKVVNRNKNLQVVNMKLGCDKKKKKRRVTVVKKIVRKIIQAPMLKDQQKNFLQETVCVDFNLSSSSGPQLLWTGVDVLPIGSLVIDNQSAEALLLNIKQSQGEFVTHEVQPRTELSLTVKGITSVEVICKPQVAYHSYLDVTKHGTKPKVCFGNLKLHLFIPLSTHPIVKHVGQYNQAIR